LDHFDENVKIFEVVRFLRKTTAEKPSDLIIPFVCVALLSIQSLFRLAYANTERKACRIKSVNERLPWDLHIEGN